MDFPAMTVKEMLTWSDDIRRVLAYAKEVAKDIQLTPEQLALLEETYAMEERRASWIDQMVLARLELEEEEGANGQIP